MINETMIGLPERSRTGDQFRLLAYAQDLYFDSFKIGMRSDEEVLISMMRSYLHTVNQMGLLPQHMKNDVGYFIDKDTCQVSLCIFGVPVASQTLFAITMLQYGVYDLLKREMVK